MSILPAWFYNEFQQVGVDFEDRVQVEAYDYNQRSSSAQAEQKLIEWLGISATHTKKIAVPRCARRQLSFEVFGANDNPKTCTESS